MVKARPPWGTYTIFCLNQSSNINKNKHTHTISARKLAQPGTTKDNGVSVFSPLPYIFWNVFSFKIIGYKLFSWRPAVFFPPCLNFWVPQWNVVALDTKMFCLVPSAKENMWFVIGRGAIVKLVENEHWHCHKIRVRPLAPIHGQLRFYCKSILIFLYVFSAGASSGVSFFF